LTLFVLGCFAGLELAEGLDSACLAGWY